MGKHKLTNEVKLKLRKAAKSLTIKYNEGYIQKKVISHKDIETNDFAPEEGINKLRTYTARYSDGERLVDEERHYKRMCDAWKKDGNEGYRQYLISLAKMKFKHVHWWDRLFAKLGWN